jgi:hypothetical protein
MEDHTDVLPVLLGTDNFQSRGFCDFRHHHSHDAMTVLIKLTDA